MIYWNEYKGHKKDIHGRKKKFDNTIYSFDIETSSYFILDNKIQKSEEYDKLSKKEQEQCDFRSCMYIWMFSINEDVYYGRTWEELESFIKLLEKVVPERKIIFIHNLSFEFQFLKSYFNFKEVMARKSHKVMKALMEDYNIELRCSLMMSNCKLAKLPKLFNLPVKKMEGDLDYNELRHSKTELTDKELGYCENDCLVVYHYIKYELTNYDSVDRLPLTSTGHVRRELKGLTQRDYKYKKRVGKAVNTDPHIYNLLIKAFAGGITHANWLYSGNIIENVDSWDFTSSYPYVMTTHKFPSTKFVKTAVTKVEEMSNMYAYLIVVKLKKVKSRYFNTLISQSKCDYIKGGKYDNGRIISAEELITTITDIDFKLILKAYDCSYEILECYSSLYNYLPEKFINFVLDKYVIKTQYKGVTGKELEYQTEKSKFNALYGMSVTNNIRDDVIYDNETGWSETPITNDEILKKLQEEEKTGFLSFAYGVWITAIARYNLFINAMKLDQYVLYMDTDSLKLKNGYDKNVILEYNKKVEERIKHVSKLLKIPYDRYAPKDIKGKERMLGVFDDDGHYEKFITQGAKKYAVTQINEEGIEEIHITVSGVPKKGAKALKSLEDFKDDFVFKHEDTGKNLLMYVENQAPIELTDLQGNKLLVKDISGCCILPTTYVLGKAQDYMKLLSEESARRAIYQEMV